MKIRRGRGPNSLEQAFVALSNAALDKTPVEGWTHNFYRYPARFSPRFAAAAIEYFSKPGDLVVDPYMGGGTTVVEGVVAGRRVLGNDLNTLATFVAKAKVTSLTSNEVAAIRKWALREVPRFSYWRSADQLVDFIDPTKSRNLELPKARFIKKAVAVALATIAELPSSRARSFAKCAVLRVTQWALDGRESHTPVADFRRKLTETTNEMLVALGQIVTQAKKTGGRATIVHGDAAELDRLSYFKNWGRAALVVTSPPYPGVHVLYHRWQVDGRRETPAPYWIAGCNDGEGGAFYNFADRKQATADKYFGRSLETLKTIRTVIRDGGYMIQMVAFNRPNDHLQRYLENMEAAGFDEVSVGRAGRIWRQVPGRKWHARQKGATNSSKEVVLIHRAV
jgi:DNA modification methylase